MSRNLNKKIKIALMVIVALFIFGHTSPQLAVRTKLFFSGHPIVAVTTEIFRKEKVADTLIYTVENSPREKATNTSLDEFIVENQLILLYFAQYRGG